MGVVELHPVHLPLTKRHKDEIKAPMRAAARFNNSRSFVQGKVDGWLERDEL